MLEIEKKPREYLKKLLRPKTMAMLMQETSVPIAKQTHPVVSGSDWSAAGLFTNLILLMFKLQ